MMKTAICVLLLISVKTFAKEAIDKNTTLAAQTVATNQTIVANQGVAVEETTAAEAGPIEAATTVPAGQVATTESQISLKTAAEDQIPLNIATEKKATETTSTSARLVFTLIILASLVGGAYYFVKKYKFSNKIHQSNMQIKVLSQHYLGPKKSLAIIRVSGESILIGITDTNISMIKSLSLIDDEVPAEAPQDFGQTLDKKNIQAEKTAMVDELDEEFSFAGVKDSVSKKIKSMRSFS